MKPTLNLMMERTLFKMKNYLLISVSIGLIAVAGCGGKSGETLPQDLPTQQKDTDKNKDASVNKPEPIQPTAPEDVPPPETEKAKFLSGSYKVNGWSCWAPGYSFVNDSYTKRSDELKNATYALNFSENELAWDDFVNLAYANQSEAADCHVHHVSNIAFLENSQFEITSTTSTCSESCSAEFCETSKDFAAAYNGTVIEYSFDDHSARLKMLSEENVCFDFEDESDSFISVDLVKSN